MYIKFKVTKATLLTTGVLLIVVVFSLLYSGFYPSTKATVANESQIKLPVIMYHSFLKDTKLQGQFVIDSQKLEDDLKMLQKKGYTTVTVKDLTDYVYNDKSLPQKPIMLTFDDGYYNNYYYAYPLLQKYKCKAVISPIAYYSEFYSNDNKLSVSYSHCTWAQLKEMIDSGYVEIQNHSYNMHTQSGRVGIKQKQGESDETYKKLITEDISTAQKYFKEKLNYTPIAFVYPFGAISDNSEDIIKALSFKCSFTCQEKVNTISKDKNSLYSLGRYIRTNKMTSEELFSKFE